MATPDKQEVPAETVMELRRLTGYGVMACKLAIKKAGSLEGAIKLINDNRASAGFGIAIAGICPDCDGGLSRLSLNECSECGWVKHEPKNRQLWGRAGRCPKCGFTSRWDGIVCSGCGYSLS